MSPTPLRRCHSARRDARSQCGVALLTLLAVVVLGAALALVAMANREPIDLRRDKLTVEALAKAKEALIAYAVTNSDFRPNEVPGYLPCPDWPGGNPEGREEPNCGSQNVTVIGRLPWKKLGIEPPRDGSGECLWYTVSGTFKNNQKTEIMNWDTLGQIEVYGPDGITPLTASKRAAAVIFAPGVALGQDRQDDNPGTAQRPVCSEDYAAARFLEADHGINNAVPNGTADAITKVIAGEKTDAFNDRLLIVTPDEIFSAIEKRKDFPEIIAKNVAECLVNYVKKNTIGGDYRFPWAAPVDLANYSVDTAYDDKPDQMSGRFPFLVNETNEANTEPFLTTHCPDNKNWWLSWKEYFFYALGKDFKPTPTPDPLIRPLPITCGSACLQVNGAGSQVAVIMFAGMPLAGQKRATASEKGDIANYLEGRNDGNHPNTLGNGNYEASACSESFNDVLYCVTLDGTDKPIAAVCPGAPIKKSRCDFQ